MKVLGITGSNVVSGNYKPVKPRESGLEIIARTCLDEMVNHGHTGENIYLRECDIEYCDHCEVCDKEERCSKNDDFAAIYRKMKAADIILLYSSVSYAMMDSKLSVLLRRAGRVSRHFGRFEGKLGGTFIEENTGGGDLVLAQFRIWYQSVTMPPPVETIIARGQSGFRHESGNSLKTKQMNGAREFAHQMTAAMQAGQKS